MKYWFSLLGMTMVYSVSCMSFYLSPNGHDQNAGNRWFLPFRTMDKALSVLRPGDSLHIMNGNYHTREESNIHLKRGGQPGQWIVIRNYLNHHPVIHGGSRAAVWLQEVEYVSFEGLTFLSDPQHAFSAGILIEGSSSKPCSHIKLYDCFVRNFGGPAVRAEGYDYITLSYNKFSRNATHLDAGAVLHFRNQAPTDLQPGYRNYLQANTMEKNALRMGPDHIICNPLVWFEEPMRERAINGYQTLVNNNIFYDNGGGGMRFERTSGVRVLNNTLYQNAQNEGCEHPELWFVHATECSASNNLFYTSTAKPATKLTNSVSVQFRHNLYYNFSSREPGWSDLVDQPQFQYIDPERKEFNFRLKPGSPAVNAGDDEGIMDIDFEGNPRKMDLHVDLGALESSSRVLPPLKYEKALPQGRSMDASWSSIFLQDQKRYTLWNLKELPFSVRVYDPIGRLLYEDLSMDGATAAFEMDFSQYPSGIYFVIAGNDASHHLERIRVVAPKR